MGWFTPAPDLSPQAAEVLQGLADSGSSESAGVADCLNTIAENGAEQAEDMYLIGCAEEIIDAAKAVVRALKPPLNVALVQYAEKGQKIRKETVITTVDEDHGVPPQTMYLCGIPTTFTCFGERAFVFADEADAQWFIDNYDELRNCKTLVRG